MPAIRDTLKQKGYILLLVPVVLMGISLMAFQMMSRSKISMRIAGAELDHLQTKFCAQQCVALAVNSTRRTLESNGKMSSHNEACTCQDPSSTDPMTCSTDYGTPTERNQSNCYGLHLSSTDLDFKVNCKEGDNNAINLNESVGFQEIPIFQFAVFYEHVLEIHPGEDMDIRGRIHANDTIRISPQKGNLYLYDWMTSTAVIEGNGAFGKYTPGVGFPLVDGTGPDAVYIFPNDGYLPLDQIFPNFSDWQKTHRVAYGDKVGTCGFVEKYSAPLKGLSDPHAIIEWRDAAKDGVEMQREKFAWRASLIYKGGWKDNSLNSVSISDPIVMPADKVLKDGSRVALWDGRDSLMIKLIPIDINKLQQRPGDSVIYLYDSYPDPTQMNADVGGFLFYNAKVLKRPLTIVSNSRIYMWGDYNTDSTFVLSGGKKSPYPSAIICDVYTQFSNEWDGRNLFMGSTLKDYPKISSGNPNAMTVLNSCLMTGIATPITSWSGAGGYHNIIHFLEDWTSVPFVYSGSTAALWSAQVSHGAATTAYYHPPVRVWSWDAMYNGLANMPPATPRVASPHLNTWEITRN